MIGFVGRPQDIAVAEEFFELFKTPWEQAVPGRRYSAVLSTSGEVEHVDADVFILYGSRPRSQDDTQRLESMVLQGPTHIEWREHSIPLYGAVAACKPESSGGMLRIGGKPADCRFTRANRTIWRIGYDLLDEVRYLLTRGQPPAEALTPTLDLHIDFLRTVLVESKISFIEIPPRPAGCDFICCLTHDVDFFGVRRHRFDRTMGGFLYRASIGSLIDLLRRRRSMVDLLKNWLACLSLPLVWAKVLPDFWRPFEDYAKVESGERSTFFLVPFRGKPGLAPDGTVHTWRAVPYGIAEIADEVTQAVNRGSELGVHGIDAWRDADAGREENHQLSGITKQTAIGIRMHWLYFNEESPKRLEEAGFDYDSTWGYNEAVGYKAGTLQVFKPIGCDRLLELPLSIMDSALFSSGRMGLNSSTALALCRQIVGHARQFGGALVVNWHERSLAPERLWTRAYHELLEQVGHDGRVWFATAGEAANWFRWRRSIKFRQTLSPEGGWSIQVSAPSRLSRGAHVHLQKSSAARIDQEVISFEATGTVEFQV